SGRLAEKGDKASRKQRTQHVHPCRQVIRAEIEAARWAREAVPASCGRSSSLKRTPCAARKALASVASTASTRLTKLRRLMTPWPSPLLSSTGAPLAPGATGESITRCPLSLPPKELTTLALASAPPNRDCPSNRA